MHEPTFDVEVHGSLADLDAIIGDLDASTGSGAVPVRSNTTDPALQSATADTVIVALTGGLAAAARAVLIEAIRSRRVSLRWKDGDREVSYDGPLRSAAEAQKVTDDLTRASGDQLPAANSVPLDGGPDEPASGEPAGRA